MIPGTQAPSRRIPVRARTVAVFALAVCTTAAAQDVREALLARAVTDDAFVRSELYSWTTESQAAALRAGGPLLWASANDGAEVSPYQRALAHDARGTDESAALAHLLIEHPALARRRYAWATPFATAVPRGGRSYGPVLIRMRVSPRAWWVRYTPGTPLRVVDSEGAPVSLADALAAPERIGVVLHVSPARFGREAYREYVLHNEQLVDGWTIDGPEIEARLTEEIELVRALARVFDRRRPRWASFTRAWIARPGHDALLEDLYAATQAFDSRRHRPEPANLAAFERALSMARHEGGGVR